MSGLILSNPPIDRIRAYFLWLIALQSLFGRIQSQNPVTDPIEAKALNTIFRRWSLTASDAWNISGELCSGIALDRNNYENYNPIIICNCNFNNGTTCRITRLKVRRMNVVGTIPEELQSLTQLFQIDFDHNYLSGPIPAFLGNLTAMKILTMGGNPLSGPIPKELGRLTKLLVLGLGSTNLTGSLPAELGRLKDFEYIFIDNCGIGGEIPSTFSNLVKLKTFQASGNKFTGKIPDFFGTFINLTDLSLQGNSFEGPIPCSLGNLNKLESLRLGDMVSGSSTLNFMRNLTSLTTLIARNALISDVLPQDFSQYTDLLHLDLSFNNITGNIPQSIFSSSSISFLFLGNNSLSGSLPAQKSNSLMNIDLSYNKLSGDFPSWVSDRNLKLNLVSNNFFLKDSAYSLLGAGFICLQQNIPCNQGSPIYSSFAINCGSQRSITAADGITYEMDGQDLSTASYYVTPDRKWGISSVGRFVNGNSQNYTWNVSNQFLNTTYSELFQSARLSPSSLRYYGMGLENGNYNVTLLYAETAFPDNKTWQSLGTRIFDVYIQGTLREKNFDIRKTAGGSFRAISRSYQARVTENFLEIHFFWAGKGSTFIPDSGIYGPAISAISVTPNFRPTVRAPSSTWTKKGVIVGVVVGILVLALLLGFFLFFIRARRKASETADYEELRAISSSAEIFSYGSLRAATKNFNKENKLGEGGFGPVFKGILADGREVAVKQLLVSSDRGKKQFVAEIATISAVRHKNLVDLLGCCVEGEKRLLVYEYLENGSLDKALFGKLKAKIDWATRMKICRGTAMGIAYLHEEASSRIVHRDIKASNVLLDADLNPKISDFGLAKLYDNKKTHISTRIAGTIGYLAPEYAYRGQLTERVDVFGFGVLVLEIVSGRPNTDTSLLPDQVYLLELVWRLHENDQELELLDPTLSDVDHDEALSLIRIALLCTQSAQLRPPMTRVVSMLVGDVTVPRATSKPSYVTDWSFSGVSSSFPSSDPVHTPSSSNSTAVPILSHSGSVAVVEGR